MSATVHVVPRNDLVEHDTSAEDDTACVCGPRLELTPCDDGSDGWVVVHHALDGREQLEARR